MARFEVSDDCCAPQVTCSPRLMQELQMSAPRGQSDNFSYYASPNRETCYNGEPAEYRQYTQPYFESMPQYDGRCMASPPRNEQYQPYQPYQQYQPYQAYQPYQGFQQYQQYQAYQQYQCMPYQPYGYMPYQSYGNNPYESYRHPIINGIAGALSGAMSTYPCYDGSYNAYNRMYPSPYMAYPAYNGYNRCGSGYYGGGFGGGGLAYMLAMVAGRLLSHHGGHRFH